MLLGCTHLKVTTVADLLTPQPPIASLFRECPPPKEDILRPHGYATPNNRSGADKVDVA